MVHNHIFILFLDKFYNHIFNKKKFFLIKILKK